MQDAGGDATAARVLRILMVSQPTGAGTARHVAELASGLTGDGFDVTVACPIGGMLSARIEREGIAWTELPMSREISAAADATSFLRLVRLCRRLRPDVLHLHSSKAGFLGRLAGHLAGVPVVVFTPHCWSFQSAEGRKRAFYVRLERFASRFCDVTITVSEQEAREATALGVVAAGKVQVIHNGLPEAEYGRREASERDTPFVSVGRLDEQKGYRYLLEAMAEVVRARPDARLAIVGDGPMRAELESLSALLGLGDVVEFCGERSPARPYLERAHVFVLSSLWEGLPYTILEAMAARLPVISTDVGGCREAVIDGETGLLVEPRNPAALAEAMRTLWTDAALRTRFGCAGHEYARRAFRLEDCVTHNAQVYEAAIAAKRSERGPRFSRRLIVGAVLVAVALLGAIVGAEISIAGRVVPGVRVGSADIGGLTRDEATRRLDRLVAAPVTVSVTPTSTGVPLDAQAVAIDVGTAVDQAYLVGRVGSWPARVARRISAARSGVTVPVRARETSAVATLLAEARTRIAREPVDATYALRDGRLSVVAEQPGVRVDARALLANLGAAATQPAGPRRTMVIPVGQKPAAVSAGELEAALGQAEAWVGRAVTGTGPGVRLELSPARIASLLTATGSGPAVSAERLAEMLAGIRVVSAPPRDARFSVSGRRVSVIDGAPGQAIDASATARALQSALSSEATSFDVAVIGRQPNVTRADLEAMGITNEISSFTTHFRQGQDGRDININLVSSAIQGTVLGIGETFSLNQITGPRNKATGYQEALVFSNGKVVPGIGGGTCQVSTTAYQAALRAGLRIVERQSHSMTVTYVPPGMDATAFYPIVDLKFMNTANGPILVWSQVKGNALTVSIFGSGKAPDIGIETDVKKKIPANQRVVYDKKLAPGVRVVEAPGVPGYIVASYRLIREDGGTTRREPLGVDEYRPRDRVIRVGY